MLSVGRAHDSAVDAALMAERNSDPGAMLADKGYDSEAIRQDLRDRGAMPGIPTKPNRKVQYSVSRQLYALRSRIECFIGHLKEQRRIATRYDKADSSFVGFVLLGRIRPWIRFVHRAWLNPILIQHEADLKHAQLTLASDGVPKGRPVRFPNPLRKRSYRESPRS